MNERHDRDLTEKGNTAPLTESQMGVYLECVRDETALQYNITFEYVFHSDTDAARLREACEKVLRHYTAFSVQIRTVDGELRMMIGETPKVGLTRLTDQEYQMVKSRFIRPFSLNGGSLCRMEIIETGSAVYLLMDIHHLIYDGVSTVIFDKALEAAYRGDELPPETATPLDMARLERQDRESDRVKEAYEYFDGVLGNTETDSTPLPDLCLQDSGRSGSFHCELDTSVQETAVFAEQLGVTENVVLLSAFTYALGKYTGQDKTLFASINSGRRGKPLNKSVGFFVRTFPLYYETDEESAVRDYILRIRDGYIGAMSHDDASFSELVSRYGIRTDVKYVYQGEIINDFTFDGHTVKKTLQTPDQSVSALDVMIVRKEQRYDVRVDYRNALYSEENIRSFARLFSRTVSQLLRAECLKDIDLVGEDLKAYRKMNDTDRPYPASQTVWELLSRQMTERSAELAVCAGEVSITYGELDRLTANLAACLVRKGIGREDFVPVLTPRNEHMAVAALGIVRAGAAYEPLDPTYPPECLNFMVQDCGARLVIADRSLYPLLNEYRGSVIFTDELAVLPSAAAFEPLDTPESALVIIYTSGTTGKPKGCVLENRNIVCFYHNHASVMGLTTGSRVANYASFGFDAGIMDLFTTLMAGASLYIIPDESRLDLDALDVFYRDHGITHGFMTTQVCRMFAEHTQCASLQAMMAGGEKLVPFNPPEGFRFVNGYGPSECIAYVCSHQVKDDSLIQPIGTPAGNTRLYVADRQLRLLPPGACGELCIAGGQVGRGYLNQPEKTAQAFIANPFTADKGYERLYRTGDVVRLLPCGELEFVGRRDGQIKIRGFRVELTEVEQVIRDYPGITNASVQAFDAPAGGKMLAAYIVAKEKISAAALCDFIRERKPDYMAPAYVLQLDAIPLNVNGKVDRRKLPAPVLETTADTQPQTDMQRRIAEKAEEVMGTRNLGANTDLFAAGLSSIGMIRLNVLLSEEFGVSLSLRDLKNHPTVAELEKCILSGKPETSDSESRDCRLTMTQEGIYIECLSAPEGTQYNIPMLLKLDERLDAGRLKQAIAMAVGAHEMMDARLFTDEEGHACLRSSGSTFAPSDVEEITAARIEDVRDSLIRPYTLLNSRLFRFTLIHADGLYLFMDVHHIIGDGTSTRILMEDIAAAYAGKTLQPEDFTGFDVAHLEEETRKGDALTLARAHYTRYFGEADGDFLPNGDLYPESERGSGMCEMDSADGAVQAAEAFCRTHSLSMNGLMLSVFGFVLARYNAEEYSVFTTVYNGRGDSRMNRTVSMLVKTLPVYVSAADEVPAELSASVSRQLMDSMVNDALSFAEINREFGIRSDVMFIYQGGEFAFDRFCDLPAAQIPLDLDDKKAPLSIQVFTRGNRFSYQADYDKERFSEKFVQAVLRAFDCAFGQWLTASRLRDVKLTDAEMLAEMDAMNRTESPVREDETMAGWFEKTAAAYPDNIAVVSDHKSYTYAWVEDLSARVAVHLQSLGIGRNDFVSVLVDRNEYMIIGTLGVIRAGAAYEPLDPAYPPERLKFMMEDAGARIVIADRQLAHLLEGLPVEILYTDEIPDLPPADGFHTAAKPDDPFVIIYTSGTTGTPKGNVLAHRNPVSLFTFHLKDAAMGPESRSAYFTGFSFDAGMLDLHASLLSGGTLYIIPDNMRLDLAAMDAFFCENRITHCCMTTQMGTLFVKMTKCKTLQYFQVGGEKLVPFTPPEGLRFVNGYGPSECAVYSSGYDVQNNALLQPIGKPHDNLKYYILDRYGNRLPFGAAGELCIAGRQVGMGYRNRPEKNKEVFSGNPFTEDSVYSRLYHTGDVVRELPDGQYDFVGRKDGQVKIRGFRVELTEVEQCIRSFPGIRNTTVQALEDPAKGKYIAAWIVADEPVDTAALSRFIAAEKPAYMVPSAFMQLQRIPLTANGKVDKRALPKPDNVQRSTGTEPADPTEKAFCEIFEKVLGIEKVYADDDFFEIGGTSITAAQAVVRLDNAGYQIVFKNLFENATPQKLARFVRGKASGDIYAPTGAEREKYDYSCLEYNVEEHLKEICTKPLGDVLLTGATGFLGAHVLRALLEKTDSRVICLIRAKSGMTADERLRMTMIYYFEDWYTDELAKRVTLIEGDLTDPDIEGKLAGVSFDTIINNAANVKHFAEGDNLLKNNFVSVENLIAMAEKRGAMLVQASSLSVCGESVNGSIPRDFRFRENCLNIGQSLENKYVHSKYLAEQAIIDAVSRGRIRGKIIRLGNLAAREADGEFQVNAAGSGLMKLMQGYIKLGCYPVDMLDAVIEFSPIDKVAEAMVLLAGTPDRFTVFHAKNCHAIHYAYFIFSLIRKGYDIQIVEHEEFDERLRQALDSAEDITAFTGFIAYMNRVGGSLSELTTYSDDASNDPELAKQKLYETRLKVISDTAFTVKALYRLGFAWPLTSREYLDSVISMLDDRAFF